LKNYNSNNSLNKTGCRTAMNNSKNIKFDDETHHSEIVVLDA